MSIDLTFCLHNNSGALHTIFTIFNAYGDKLNAANWITCQRHVVLRLLSGNEVEYRRIPTSQSHEEVKASWNKSVAATLDATASLYEHYASDMVSDPDSRSFWEDFAQCIKGLLDRRSLRISTAVFTSLSRILGSIKEADIGFPACSRLTWDIWRMNNPAEYQEHDLGGKIDNQAALLAYIQCFKVISITKDEEFSLSDVEEILKQLEACAVSSTPPSYGSDVDNLSPLQDQLIETFGTIRSNADGVQLELIKCASFFVTLAFSQGLEGSDGKRSTYVALSKSAMDLLKLHLMDFINDPKFHASDALSCGLEALATPICLKYRWTLEGKEPLTWQKATTTTVSILNAAVPVLREIQGNGLNTSFWKEALNSCDAIISADVTSCNIPSRISRDEEFDIEAYIHIRKLLTSALGSASISDDFRWTYIESVFKNSIIHEPHPDDLSKSGRDILSGLHSKHIGRVQDLPPNQRLKMSYGLLDELFDLVAVHDGSPERIRLAQAAAPFFILRVSVVLKAYILDHPLRGRMPQPMSQKREMFHILRKLVELDSEPSAIPNPSGIVSKHKKHLHRVFELVTKALAVARRDEEMQEALGKVIEAVGEDFGV